MNSATSMGAVTGNWKERPDKPTRYAGRRADAGPALSRNPPSMERCQQTVRRAHLKAFAGPDNAAAKRAMDAMLPMTRIDIAT